MNLSIMNTVDSIIVNYSHLTVERKVLIRDLGRPMPQLAGLQQKLKIRNRPDSLRKFNTEFYRKTDWLCGCEVRNKLFCFPCLLCARNRNEAWVKEGVSDLAHLAKKIEKHESAVSHKNALVDLRILGRQNIIQQLDSAYRLNLIQKNETIKKIGTYFLELLIALNFAVFSN